MKKFLLAATLSVASFSSAFAASGVASWYGSGFHGKKTANGETFNMYSMTAAHKTLPFGSKVKVTNLRNGKSTTVCINDRGPYAHGRVIDLSKKANQTIGCNLCKVKLEVVHKPTSWKYGRKVC